MVAPSKALQIAVEDHEILPVEMIGDLLVVSPVGDPIGFSQTVFRTELNRVKQLANGPTVRNVLFDFSDADYFGSAMIGSLIELRREVAIGHGQHVGDDEVTTATVESGGVTAVCGLSHDMLTGLQILSVDRLVSAFDDRRTAVRALAKESVRQWIARARLPWYRASAAMLVVVATCLLMFTPLGFAVFGGTAIGDFEKVTAIYERWELRAKGAMTKELRLKASAPLLVELRELRDNLQDKEVSLARRSVAIASGRLTAWIAYPDDFDNRLRFRDSLANAKQAIFEETGVAVAFPPELGVGDVALKEDQGRQSVADVSTAAGLPESGHVAQL